MTLSATRRPLGPAPTRQSAPELLSAAERQKMLFNKQLPTTSPLGKAARALDSTWGDENIQSGVVSAFAGKTKPGATDAQLEALATSLFTDALKATDEAKPAGRMKVTQSDVPTMTAKAGKQVAVDGFAYTDSPDNVTPVQAEIAALVKKLGKPADVKAIRVEGAMMQTQDDPPTKVPANLFLFANTRTGELVSFYERHGEA